MSWGWSGLSFRDGYAGYFDGDGGDSFGPGRRDWAAKSSAALNRERIADGLFDKFLDKCSELTPSLFPITEEVVMANVHLTEACYKSFRRRVMDKGCKVKRREATLDERENSDDKRKCKLYVISVTCPVHPSKFEEAKAKAEEAAAARHAKAVAAAKRKAEKEKREKKERDRLAALHMAKVREEYASIVGIINDDDEKTTTSTSSNKRQHNTPTTTTTKKKKGSSSSSPSSARIKVASKNNTTVVVTQEDIVKHAKNIHKERRTIIRTEHWREENQLLSELQTKHDVEIDVFKDQIMKKRSQMLDEESCEFKDIETKIEEAFKNETTTTKSKTGISSCSSTKKENSNNSNEKENKVN